MNENIDSICIGVKRIAWGFFIVLFNFNLGILNILPDWAGYMIMVSALSFISDEKESAKLLKPIGIILILWNMADWVFEILSVTNYFEFIGIVPSVLNIYFCFQLFTDLADIAEKYSCSQSKTLLVLRSIYVVFTSVSVIILFYGIIDNSSEFYETLAFVLSLITVLLAVLILVTLFSLSSQLKKISC